MPNTSYLVITLRKKVSSESAALDLLNYVKQRLSDHPEVIISGQITTRIEQEDIPS